MIEMAKMHEIVKVRDTSYDSNSRGHELSFYDEVALCECDECGSKYVGIRNTDPGSTEEAIGVRELCTECWGKDDVEPFIN